MDETAYTKPLDPPPPPPPPPPAGRLKKSTMTEHWIIDLKNEWNASTISKERKEMKRRRCIYRFPRFMWTVCTRPQVVSLGPYHHGHPQFKPMEKLKRRMLGYYLAKIGKDLEEAVAAMRSEVEDLMMAYDGLETVWNDDKERFVQLMVVDGCFLLELHFLMHGMEDDDDLRICYDEIWPVSSAVHTDTIVLENQVPIRALEIMAELGRDKVPTTNVWRLLLKNEVPDDAIDDFKSEEFVHKLHAIWVSRLIGNNFLFKSRSEREVNPPTVTELVAAGIKIKKSDWMIISFEKGILKLPHFKFVDGISWYCYNLMSFEMMHNLDPEFYSYLEFMDALIDSRKDTEYLRKRGIIGGGLPSDHNIATFFNVTANIAHTAKRKWRTTGEDVAKSLADYCRRWQNRWPAGFRHLYLEDPWKFFSLMGALFLLALTVVSTVYTTLQYYNS